MELQTEDKRGGSCHNLMKYIPGGLRQCRVDEYFTIIYMSESFYSLSGYTKEEVKNLFQNRYINMVVPEDREQLKESVRGQLEAGDVVNTEYRIRRKDGTLLWILNRGRAVAEEDGSVCTYCLCLDITEQNRERAYAPVSGGGPFRFPYRPSQ